MEVDMDHDVDLSTDVQEILLAATNHDIQALEKHLANGSANVRDEDTGCTPLHAAIAACEDDPEVESEQAGLNGDGAATIHGKALQQEGAVATIRVLLENGAIWNDLDHNDETPGCVALRLDLKDAYQMIVDAGVRAELLLNRLDEFEMLEDQSEGEEGEGQEADEVPEGQHRPADGDAVHLVDVPQLIMTDADGVQADADVTSDRYLASELSFTGDRLLDADDNGVMMAWETDLMRQSAHALIGDTGKRVLNIGHGMGIIDKIFEEQTPAEHHIIEAHPAVLKRLREEGWYDKVGVTIHEGRWQEEVPKLVDEGKVFDAIYFDTFAEDYKQLRDFFSEHVISLLDPDGRFGFFNGLGADRQVCYDVYTKVVEMDLFEAGLDTEWKDIKIADLDANDEWEGVRRKYWALSVYRMPTCTFVG